MFHQKPRILVLCDPIRPDAAAQCDCGCDCACVNTARPMAQPEQPFSRHVPYQARFYQNDLGQGQAVCYYPGLTQPVVLNRPALNLLNRFQTPTSINNVVNNFDNTDGDSEELFDFAARAVSLGLLAPDAAISSVPVAHEIALTAWLHLTDVCNLRCDYCYVPRRHRAMSPDIGRAAIDAAFRSASKHAYQQVKLKYSGGEPLLNFPLIVELHRYACQQASQYGLELDGVILSNGTRLTPDTIAAIRALELRLMISLDGLGALHDCQRRYADGHASSQDVVQGITLALEHGLTPDISITVSGRNVEGLAELMAWVLERDLPFSLNFYRQNETSQADAGSLNLAEERLIHGMLAAYAAIAANLPRRSLLASLVDRANLSAPHLRPCSMGRSYLVVDPQGRVAQCQMQLEHPLTTVSADDPLSDLRHASIGIRNVPVDEKPACADCRWKYWCAGGCPLTAYRAAGRCDAQSPHCAIYTALFPEVVRLDGLRIMTYAAEG